VHQGERGRAGPRPLRGRGRRSSAVRPQGRRKVIGAQLARLLGQVPGQASCSARACGPSMTCRQAPCSVHFAVLARAQTDRTAPISRTRSCRRAGHALSAQVLCSSRHRARMIVSPGWPLISDNDVDGKTRLVWLAPEGLTAGRTVGRDDSLAVGEGGEVGPHWGAAEAGYVRTATRPG